MSLMQLLLAVRDTPVLVPFPYPSPLMGLSSLIFFMCFNHFTIFSSWVLIFSTNMKASLVQKTTPSISRIQTKTKLFCWHKHRVCTCLQNYQHISSLGCFSASLFLKSGQTQEHSLRTMFSTTSTRSSRSQMHSQQQHDNIHTNYQSFKQTFSTQRNNTYCISINCWPVHILFS